MLHTASRLCVVPSFSSRSARLSNDNVLTAFPSSKRTTSGSRVFVSVFYLCCYRSSVTTFRYSYHVHYTQKYYANMRMLLASGIFSERPPYFSRYELLPWRVCEDSLSVVRGLVVSRDPACEAEYQLKSFASWGRSGMFSSPGFEES